MTLREQDAQPDLQISPESRTAEPDGGQSKSGAHHAPAAVTPSARQPAPLNQSGNASAGVALTSLDDQGSSGDPTPFDRANVLTDPQSYLPGHLDGHTPQASQSARAVETYPDPADGQANPTRDPQDRGDGRSSHDNLDCAAVAETTGPAIPALTSNVVPQGRGVRRSARAPLGSAADAKLSGPAKQTAGSKRAVQDRGDGQPIPGSHSSSAVAAKSRPARLAAEPKAAVPGEGDGHPGSEAHSAPAVATIVDVWRQRVDLRRAEGRLNLQALAVCRRASQGDKEASQKLWAQIQKGKGPDDVSTVVEPYRSAMAVLDGSASALEKQLAKMVRKLPLWTTWAIDVRGMGELSLAGVLGEASGNPGDYKSVSALWKRFGLAVIEGQRQRRVANAEDALLHGYAPQRRAFAYVLSTNLMKCQKAEDPYRMVYDQRKAYELARDIPKAHAHNRALRVMVKALFRDLFAADRRGC